MRLSEYRDKLKGIRDFSNSNTRVSDKTLKTLNKTENIDEMKIIGITGSKGKSTICNIVHDYLKYVDKRSILYSSNRIDSMCSFKNEDACDVAIYNEDCILDFIDEAAEYDSEYLVLEVNESTIEKGLVNDIDFTIRVISNIYPKNSLSFYEEDVYVNLKKSFFKNIPNENECKCILGMCDPLRREDFNELVKINNCEKVTFGSKYYCEYRNANYNNLDYMIFSENNKSIASVNGLNFKLRVKDKIYDLKTKLIMPFIANDIICAIAILDTLNVLDMSKFLKFIENYKIVGRDEVIKKAGRTFVIGVSLMPHLEVFDSFKRNNEINKIKLILGTSGDNYKTWDKSLTMPKRLKTLPDTKRRAALYASKYCDYIYLTSNDPASNRPFDLIKELSTYMRSRDMYEVVVNRKDAIKKAVFDSKVGDLIYISGRGNRKVFCNSFDNAELFTDKEVLEKVFEELGW